MMLCGPITTSAPIEALSWITTPSPSVARAPTRAPLATWALAATEASSATKGSRRHTWGRQL